MYPRVSVTSNHRMLRIGFLGARKRISDRVFDALWRGTDQLNFLVNMITHAAIFPCPLKEATQNLRDHSDELCIEY